MASITKRGNSWFAQIRRKGHRSISRSFPKQSQAVEWAGNIEAEIEAKRFQDTRSASEWLLNPNELTGQKIMSCAEKRRKAGAGGVTISI